MCQTDLKLGLWKFFPSIAMAAKILHGISFFEREPPRIAAVRYSSSGGDIEVWMDGKHMTLGKSLILFHINSYGYMILC